MDVLKAVLTISEVARMWGYRYQTVYYAMGAKRRPLEFRRAGRTFLISYDSCLARWGKPIYPFF